jgi:glucose/arabinose dehydrogenase
MKPGRVTVAVLTFALVNAAWAQSVMPGTKTIRLELIADVGSLSLDLKTTGSLADDRLFVATQGGEVRLIDGGSLVTAPFLNVAGAGVPLVSGGERGLLGIAFHPDYLVDGADGFRKFYTYTSETPSAAANFNHPELSGGGGDHHSVIREWTVSTSDPDAIDTTLGSRVLMRINQPQANHNGGALAFGHDGYLYISLGDGGGGDDFNGSIASFSDGHTNSPGPGQPHGNAQDITNVYGKILRIKPTTDADAGTTLSANGQYRVPNLNPFSGAAAGVDEIFAYGLRNPFRMSFDRSNGELWLGDVGQGSREEVNKVTLGGNYGWVTKEGTLVRYSAYPTAGLTDPEGEYSSAYGHSVMGGFMYRGSLMPQLEGEYVFGDAFGPSFAAGRMLVLDPDTHVVRDLLLDAEGAAIASTLYGFGEDAEGELYAVFSNGQVMAILPPLGDWNFSGARDNSDIQPMLDALVDLEGYQAEHGLSDARLVQIGDINRDAAVNNLDIQAMLDLLTSGGESVEAVAAPEPSTAASITALGLFALSRPRACRTSPLARALSRPGTSPRSSSSSA